MSMAAFSLFSGPVYAIVEQPFILIVTVFAKSFLFTHFTCAQTKYHNV